MSSAKRAAGRQLNHDNWDDEDEPEEAGVFKQVSTEIQHFGYVICSTIQRWKYRSLLV